MVAAVPARVIPVVLVPLAVVAIAALSFAVLLFPAMLLVVPVRSTAVVAGPPGGAPAAGALLPLMSCFRSYWPQDRGAQSA